MHKVFAVLYINLQKVKSDQQVVYVKSAHDICNIFFYLFRCHVVLYGYHAGEFYYTRIIILYLTAKNAPE